MALKKPVQVAKDADRVEFVMDDPWFTRDYPTLWEWFTAEKWEDGSARQTSSFTLFAEEGKVKMCFNDRALARMAFVTADTVEGVLAAAERQLRDGTADWRPSTWGKGRGKK